LGVCYVASFSLAQGFGLHCFDAPGIGVKSSEPVLTAVPDQRALLIVITEDAKSPAPRAGVGSAVSLLGVIVFTVRNLGPLARVGTGALMHLHS
jgi:hypothetical protein